MINWFLEIHNKLNLSYKTIFNAINLLDNFNSIKTGKIFYISLISLFLSIKIFDFKIINLKSFLKMVKADTEKYLEKEIEFVNTINFRLR